MKLIQENGKYFAMQGKDKIQIDKAVFCIVQIMKNKPNKIFSKDELKTLTGYQSPQSAISIFNSNFHRTPIVTVQKKGYMWIENENIS